MTDPATRKFTAQIDLRPPEPGKLIVTGEVKTTNGAIKPMLHRRNPQGINPRILLLNLTIVDTGLNGTADIGFRDASYEESAAKDQFTQVDIYWEGKAILYLPVSETN